MSSNVNRIFMIGLVKELKFEDSYCTFLLNQIAHYKSGDSDVSKSRISEYKVLIHKANVIEILKNAGNIENFPVLITGYIASVDKRGDANYVSGLVFHEDKYLNVVEAQEVIFLQKPTNFKEEQFQTQLCSLNVCFLMGNTGADPEIKEVKDKDLKIANISIATNMHYRYQDQKRESTTWHKVAIVASQNNLAGLVKVVENSVKRGDKLFIIGSLQARKRDDRHGDEMNSIQVTLQNSNNANLSIIISKHRNENRDYADKSRDYTDNSYINNHSQRNSNRNVNKSYHSEYDSDSTDVSETEEDDNIPF